MGQGPQCSAGESTTGIQPQALKKRMFGADTSVMNTCKPPLWRCVWPQVTTVGALLCGLAGMGSAGLAQAEWAELEKTEQFTHFFDKDSVKVAHVTRYAWTLTELPEALGATGAPGAASGPKVKSTLTRWRVHCVSDMVARLSYSVYELPQGKGTPLSSQDETEWRVRETPIRPGSVQALLKKEVCQ